MSKKLFRCYLWSVWCFFFGHEPEHVGWGVSIDDDAPFYEQTMCARCWQIKEVVR
jgi:hypothetical protein